MNDLAKEFGTVWDENRDLREEVKRKDREMEHRAALERTVLQDLVAGKIPGRKVAVIYLDDPKHASFETDLPTTLSLAGASVTSETTLSKGFITAIGKLSANEFEQLGLAKEVSGATVASKVAEMVCSGDEQGLKLLDGASLIKASTTEAVPPSAVVVFADPSDADDARVQGVDVPLLEGLSKAEAQVVVGLGSDVPDTEAGHYRKKAAALVDAANTIPGQVELIEAIEAHAGPR